MGLLNTPIEESTRFINYGIKLQEVAEANLGGENRTLVVVVDEQWKEFADNDHIIRTSFVNWYPGIFPEPNEYGDNFLANVSALFNQRGSDVTVFKSAERIDDSPNAAQWEYLLNKVAEGAHFVDKTDGRKFDYRRRNVLLLCSRVPEFVKRRPDLWPVVVEIEGEEC